MVGKMKYFEMITEKTAHWFDVDTCEECGCIVEAPNTVTACENRKTLLDFGCIERKKPVSDLMWCDALGIATCDNCYVEDD